uniref:Clathrin light chain n=2 Tax=Meloidogyne incognita group TaxID=654580 RepID=A0A915LG54_MELJA
MEFLEDEDTKAFFAQLEKNSDKEEIDDSLSDDNLSNDTAEFFDQLELVEHDNKNVEEGGDSNINEHVSQEVNEQVMEEVNEYVSVEANEDDGQEVNLEINEEVIEKVSLRYEDLTISQQEVDENGHGQEVNKKVSLHYEDITQEVDEYVSEEVNQNVSLPYENVCEEVDENVSQEISKNVSEEKRGCEQNEVISDEKFDDFLRDETDVLLNEFMAKWRKLQDKKREFFKMELKKMELDNALSGRVKKVGYKWNEYENGTASELRNALKELRMSRN